MLVASTLLIGKTTVFPGPWTLLPVAGTLLLLAAGSNASAISNRLLRAKPLVKIVDWSYSMYLWHWPFIAFSKHLWPESSWVIVLAAKLSLAPAIASYYFVEKPIRFLDFFTSRRKTRLVLTVILTPAIAAVSLYSFADNWLKPRVESGVIGKVINDGAVGQQNYHEFVHGQYFPCLPEKLRQNAPYSHGFLRCHQSKMESPVEVALIGDSHAEQLFPGLAHAFPETNIAYFILGEVPVRSSSEEMAQIIQYVIQDPNIRAVVLTARWELRGVPESKLAATIRDIYNSGKIVFVTDGIPSFPFGPTQCRNAVGLFHSEPRCDVSADSNLRVYDGYIDSLRRAVGQAPGAQLLESNKHLCGPESCSMALGGKLFFRDNNHLNVNGSRFLVDRLISANPDLRQALVR